MSEPKPETRAVLLERILRIEQRNEQLEFDMREMRSQRNIARERAEEYQQTIVMKDMQIAGILKVMHRYQGAIVAMPGGVEIAKAIHEIDAPEVNHRHQISPEELEKPLRR